MDRNAIVNTVISCITVALRKESVDRNINCNCNFTQKKQSLSARRAWIEMALSAERFGNVKGRSPQGERG